MFWPHDESGLLRQVDRLIDCLMARQQRKVICANVGGGKLAQSAKDGLLNSAYF